jgi:hypothetical protein
VLLYCTESQDLLIDSELVHALLGQMAQTTDNTILNLITHIIHLHCLFPSTFSTYLDGKLAYKAEVKLGLKAIERLRGLQTESAQYYITLLESIYEPSFQRGKY